MPAATDAPRVSRRGATRPEGTVYLLHFDEPYRHAKHYIGFTEDLDRRLVEHQTGAGARLIEVIINAGRSFTLARTWPGDRTLERRLHRRKASPRFCPVCRRQLALSLEASR